MCQHATGFRKLLTFLCKITLPYNLVMERKFTLLLLVVIPLFVAMIFFWTPKAKWPGGEDKIVLKTGETLKGFILTETESALTFQKVDGERVMINSEDISHIYRNPLGLIQKIFYFHVPLAWSMLLAFFFTFLFSVIYLKRRKPIYDAYAVASAEVGVVTATLAVISGSLWAKPAWGTYWLWDPRLTTMLILWFTFVGYLILRGFVEEENLRARLSALVAILGFIDIPLVYLSAHLWRSIHPVVISSKKGVTIDPKMRITLFLGFLLFSLFVWILIKIRVRIELIRNEIEKHLEESL